MTTRIGWTFIAAALFSVGVVACAKTGDKAFRARAAQDLNCPEGELFIEHKWEGSDASKRASGCGREAFYLRECAHEGCLWKLKASDTATATATDTAASTGTASAAAPTDTATASGTGTASASAATATATATATGTAH